MTICAFTAVCEEDKGWIAQYLAEVERLEMPFCCLYDRLQPQTAAKLTDHPLNCGSVSREVAEGEFNEQCKQPLLDLVQAQGFNWGLAWDIDETWEADAQWILKDLVQVPVSMITTRWLNLWGDTKHVRTDLMFSRSYRPKLYNLQAPHKWVYDHPITNGPKRIDQLPFPAPMFKSELVCLHHGMMTHELRRLHKARWDRIYSTALRGDVNPYGFWKDAIDTEAEAVTIRHGYTTSERYA